MLKLLAVACLALVASSCAQTTSSISPSVGMEPLALSAQPTLMRASGPAFAPPAFYAFCKARADLCASTGSIRKMEMTAARQQELKDVNLQVNRRIREVSDLEV